MVRASSIYFCTALCRSPVRALATIAPVDARTFIAGSAVAEPIEEIDEEEEDEELEDDEIYDEDELEDDEFEDDDEDDEDDEELEDEEDED